MKRKRPYCKYGVIGFGPRRGRCRKQPRRITQHVVYWPKGSQVAYFRRKAKRRKRS